MRKLRFFKRVVAAVAAVAISVTAIGSYNDSFADKFSSPVAGADEPRSRHSGKE